MKKLLVVVLALFLTSCNIGRFGIEANTEYGLSTSDFYIVYIQSFAVDDIKRIVDTTKPDSVFYYGADVVILYRKEDK